MRDSRSQFTGTLPLALSPSKIDASASELKARFPLSRSLAGCGLGRKEGGWFGFECTLL